MYMSWDFKNRLVATHIRPAHDQFYFEHLESYWDVFRRGGSVTQRLRRASLPIDSVELTWHRVEAWRSLLLTTLSWKFLLGTSLYMFICIINMWQVTGKFYFLNFEKDSLRSLHSIWRILNRLKRNWPRMIDFVQNFANVCLTWFIAIFIVFIPSYSG